MPGPSLPLALALLAAAPSAKPTAAGPEDVTLAAPTFETHGLSRKEVKDVAFYSAHFADRLAGNGLQVLTPDQIASVPELQKLMSVAGCSTTITAECIIQMGHLLGAQGVVRGTLAKVGESFQIDVRVYRASDGKVLASKSASARNTEALVRAMDQLAVETASLVKAAFAPPKPEVKVLTPPPPPLPIQPPPPPPPAPADYRGLAWLPGAVGVLAGGASGLCFGLAQKDRADLANGIPPASEGPAVRRRGETYATAGAGLAAGAGAALLGAGALYFFGGPKAAAAVTPAPSGVRVEVRFP